MLIYFSLYVCWYIKKSIPVMFGHVTTHYQTLQTWIDYNATCCHNFNALPHPLPYIFSEFIMDMP